MSIHFNLIIWCLDHMTQPQNIRHGPDDGQKSSITTAPKVPILSPDDFFLLYKEHGKFYVLSIIIYQN